MAARARRRRPALARRHRRGLHNRYDLLRQQAFAEGEATDRPDRRPFLLCRSGGPGMQRFGAAAGRATSTRTFADARGADRASASMSACPACRYWGTDIGGFYPVGARRRRAVRALVPVRRVLPGLPRPRPRLARASALGVRPGDRGDLPPLSRAALPADALHLHARLAGARARAAADAAAGAQLSRRSRASGISARSISGATTSWSRR